MNLRPRAFFKFQSPNTFRLFLTAEARPFFHPDSDDGIAFCFRPDVMEEEELQQFPEFGK
jgi:hypothetical protein